jgi:hypothetical protein
MHAFFCIFYWCNFLLKINANLGSNWWFCFAVLVSFLVK